MGNIYPNEKNATTLKQCRELKTQSSSNKSLVENKMRGKTTSNGHVYVEPTNGVLEFKSIELEKEVQYLKEGVYLHSHLDIEETREIYKYSSPNTNARQKTQLGVSRKN